MSAADLFRKLRLRNTAHVPQSQSPTQKEETRKPLICKSFRGSIFRQKAQDLFPLIPVSFDLNNFASAIWQGLLQLFQLSSFRGLSDFLLPNRCHESAAFAQSGIDVRCSVEHTKHDHIVIPNHIDRSIIVHRNLTHTEIMLRLGIK